MGKLFDDNSKTNIFLIKRLQLTKSRRNSVLMLVPTQMSLSKVKIVTSPMLRWNDRERSSELSERHSSSQKKLALLPSPDRRLRSSLLPEVHHSSVRSAESLHRSSRRSSPAPRPARLRRSVMADKRFPLKVPRKKTLNLDRKASPRKQPASRPRSRLNSRPANGTQTQRSLMTR